MKPAAECRGRDASLFRFFDAPPVLGRYSRRARRASRPHRRVLSRRLWETRSLAPRRAGITLQIDAVAYRSSACTRRVVGLGHTSPLRVRPVRDVFAIAGGGLGTTYGGVLAGDHRQAQAGRQRERQRRSDDACAQYHRERHRCERTATGSGFGRAPSCFDIGRARATARAASREPPRG